MGRLIRAAGRARARIDAGERGAALVEAAILMPVVLLIVFGAIEFSSLYKDAATLSSATRAGGRTASAEPRNANMPTDTAAAVSTALSTFPSSAPQQLWVYDATFSSNPPGSCSGNCVSFTWNPSSKTFNTGTYDPSRPPTWISDQNACSNQQTWARVGVYVTAQHPFVTNLFGVGTTKSLSSNAIFRIEPLPSSQCT
jgi:Flp pilus assembly protein TadG